MGRVATASMIGTMIGFYDFFSYGTAAALVFSTVYFPELGAAQGTALAVSRSSRGRSARSSSGTSATGSAADAPSCLRCCSWASPRS